LVRNLYVYFETKTTINGRLVHKVVAELKKELGLKISSLQINFVNEENIIKLNKTHLNHNYSTDVITLDYSGNAGLIDGEIFISLDDAAYNARKFKVTLKDELLRLIVHGILHLTGYDDTTSKQKSIMKQKEEYLLTLMKSKTDK